MNVLHSNSTLLKTVSFSASLLLLTACGGGGGGGESSTSSSAAAPTPAPTTQTETPAPTPTPTTETVTYDPDPQLQLETAGSSDELYVETTFEFNTHKTVTIDVQAVDDTGAPLADVVLFLSEVPTDVTELDDPKMADKSLIAVFKTDGNGSIYQQIEVSVNVNNTLLELNTMGIENELIMPVGESMLIQHQFK